MSRATDFANRWACLNAWLDAEMRRSQCAMDPLRRCSRVCLKMDKTADREPEAGDVYTFVTELWTVQVPPTIYEKGAQIKLISKTDDAPFGFHDPKGNWWVEDASGNQSIWSSIRMCISRKYITLNEKAALDVSCLPGPFSAYHDKDL